MLKMEEATSHDLIEIEEAKETEISSVEQIKNEHVLSLSPVSIPIHTTPLKHSKKYRKQWESDPLLSEWLVPYPYDECRAMCKICNCTMRAHKHDLTTHARSTRHLRSLQGKDTNPYRIDIQSGKTKLTESSNAHRSIKLEESAEEILTNELRNNKEGSKGKRKVALNRKTEIAQHLLNKKNRKKLTVAEVLAAIEEGDFTGYELLHVVKSAVPRL